MAGILRAAALGLIVVASLADSSCGDGNASYSTTPPATTNVVTAVVDSGPTPATPTLNTLYVSVTVCVPGSTTQCQVVDHIQVDTQSYGLRILAAVSTLNFTATAASDGNSLVECTQFADGYSWGPIALADIQVAGEKASSVPIQLIGSSQFATVPAACSGTGNPEDTVAQFGANGILGIGVFAQDCGPGCAASNAEPHYYSCTTSTCLPIAVPLAKQVLNPVPLFTTDNNGTIITLPSVGASGEATVSGTLIFGIDTQSNNVSGAETVLTVDPNYGEFATVYNSQSYGTSIIDSGTNGIYFDSAITLCSNVNLSEFYCPPSTESFSATLTGQNNVTTTASFSVANAQTLLAATTVPAAIPGLAGPFSSTFPNATTTFDWGLPFFYGRRVITAIEGFKTSQGTGPYVAF